MRVSRAGAAPEKVGTSDTDMGGGASFLFFATKMIFHTKYMCQLGEKSTEREEPPPSRDRQHEEDLRTSPHPSLLSCPSSNRTTGKALFPVHTTEPLAPAGRTIIAMWGFHWIEKKATKSQAGRGTLLTPPGVAHQAPAQAGSKSLMKVSVPPHRRHHPYSPTDSPTLPHQTRENSRDGNRREI